MAKNKKTTKSVRQVFAGEEISLVELIKLFTDRKVYVLIGVVIFFVMGVLIALTSPIEYRAEATLLSENGGASASSGLAGLAGLAGVSLPGAGGSSGSSLGPDMYPAILKSQPFLLELMEEKFYFQEKGKEMSLYEYFSEERPGHIFTKAFQFLRGIPARFFALFERSKSWDIPADLSEAPGETGVAPEQRSKIVHVTYDQKYVISQLEPRITVEAEGRMIAFSAKMPEPLVSAQLNTIVLQKVVDYVTAYKTEKQRENLKFIQERTIEAEQKFKGAQLRLAEFRDANQGIVTQTARTREEQLQAEYQLAFNIYNGLAQQLEQTKIELKKETPLFTEFEPVTVPLQKSEPSVSGIIITYIAFGVVFGGMAIFVSIVVAFMREPAPGSEHEVA